MDNKHIPEKMDRSVKRTQTRVLRNRSRSEAFSLIQFLNSDEATLSSGFIEIVTKIVNLLRTGKGIDTTMQRLAKLLTKAVKQFLDPSWVVSYS